MVSVIVAMIKNKGNLGKKMFICGPVQVRWCYLQSLRWGHTVSVVGKQRPLDVSSLSPLDTVQGPPTQVTILSIIKRGSSHTNYQNHKEFRGPPFWWPQILAVYSSRTSSRVNLHVWDKSFSSLRKPSQSGELSR